MILAIDPGSTKAGFAIFQSNGVLVHSGIIKNVNMKDSGFGLSDAARDLALLIYSGPYLIDTIVVEKMFVRSAGMVNTKLPIDCSMSSGVLVGITLGVINAMSSSSRVKVIHVMPRTWQKVSIAKSGKIAKADIRHEAARLYGGKYLNDESDAILIGHWWLKKGRVN